MSNSSMSISFCIILFYFILCKCVIMYIYIYIHTIPDNLTTKGTISKSICRTSQHFQLTGFVNKMCHVHLCRLMRVEPGSPPKVVWELIVRNRDHNETYGYMYIYIYIWTCKSPYNKNHVTLESNILYWLFLKTHFVPPGRLLRSKRFKSASSLRLKKLWRRRGWC